MDVRKLVGVIIAAVIVVALLPIFTELADLLPEETPGIVTMLITTLIPIILVLAVVMAIFERTPWGK